MELQNMERRLYKNFRKDESTQSKETNYGTNFFQVEKQYLNIYQDYLQNLLINLISYQNTPVTFDGRFCEWCLRTFGYCRIGGDDSNNIFVLEPENNTVLPETGKFGFMIDKQEINSPFNHEELHQITRFNVKDLDRGYITLANKYNYYFGTLGQNFSDMELINRTAQSLAYIKATEIFNLQQMHVPYIGFSKNKNLTALNVWKQINNAMPFINVGDDVDDLDSVVKLANLNIPNFLADLKQQWNNELSEMLTMLGINNVGVDKRERLVKDEVDANSQLIEASGNIYLDARNSQLELLNHVLGTNIKAVFNQAAYKQLVQLMTDTRTDIHAIEDSEDRTGDDLMKGVKTDG